MLYGKLRNVKILAADQELLWFFLLKSPQIKSSGLYSPLPILSPHSHMWNELLLWHEIHFSKREKKSSQMNASYHYHLCSFGCASTAEKLSNPAMLMSHYRQQKPGPVASYWALLESLQRKSRLPRNLLTIHPVMTFAHCSGWVRLPRKVTSPLLLLQENSSPAVAIMPCSCKREAALWSELQTHDSNSRALVILLHRHTGLCQL